jgi:hypothetical protein
MGDPSGEAIQQAEIRDSADVKTSKQRHNLTDFELYYA